MKILKTNSKIKKFGLLVCVFVLALSATTFWPHQPASAIAPGCSSAKPTAITGTVTGFGGAYHNWSVNVLIGFDLANSKNQKVDTSGNVISGGVYSTYLWVNKNLAQPGTASDLRSFGRVCVSTAVKTAWFELYPKDTHGVTTKTYYGGANDQQMPIRANATNNFLLRIPTAHEYGGNTGDVNGYISYKGHSVSPSNLVVRAFPYQGGAACGVQGFSAGADSLAVSGSINATYYLVKNLAGGQCNGSYQPYKIIVSCKNNACGGGTRTITIQANVSNGQRPRKDFRF